MPNINYTRIERVMFWIGTVIKWLGKASIPFGIGIIVGFYFSDQEMKFVPTALEVSLGLFVFGFLSVPLGRLLQGRAYEVTQKQVRLRKRMVIFSVLASLAVLVRLLLFSTEAPSPLTELPKHKFETAYEIDTAKYIHLRDTLTNASIYFEEVLGEDSSNVLTADQEIEVLSTWQSVTNAAFAMDQVRMFFEDWYRFDVSRTERKYHLRSFLLMFASELVLYDTGLRIADCIDGHPHAVKFLDAPHPEQGLAADSFSRFRQELLGAKDEAIVTTGQQYLVFLEKGFKGEKEASALGLGWLLRDIEQRLDTISHRSPVEKASRGAAADFQQIKRVTRRNWFSVQKSTAEWMGDTRVRRIGTYLITPEQQKAIDAELEPGDILIARKNWYLSNVGLPGFWPHAMIYLGNPVELDRYFDTEEVRTYIETLSESSQTLSQYLAEATPAAWRAYLQKDHGVQRKVLEAISEGVSFSTLGHTTGDYFAALRPGLTKADKAKAIIEAFRHIFKPYDFDFDFATDHALVCTELVWRSYRPAEGKAGVEFPLVKVMGRKTLPANNIAGYFAATRNELEPPLRFVLFYDANDHEQEAFKSTEAAFVQSYSRTKWDLALP